jgi:hypothetical protein
MLFNLIPSDIYKHVFEVSITSGEFCITLEQKRSRIIERDNKLTFTSDGYCACHNAAVGLNHCIYDRYCGSFGFSMSVLLSFKQVAQFRKEIIKQYIKNTSYPSEFITELNRFAIDPSMVEIIEKIKTNIDTKNEQYTKETIINLLLKNDINNTSGSLERLEGRLVDLLRYRDEKITEERIVPGFYELSAGLEHLEDDNYCLRKDLDGEFIYNCVKYGVYTQEDMNEMKK